MAEAATAEVCGDPDRAVGRLDQQVDVVVAGSDRAQLCLGALSQRPRALAPGDLLGQLRYGGPCLRVEQPVLDAGGILAADPEAEAARDLVGQPSQVAPHLVDR